MPKKQKQKIEDKRSTKDRIYTVCEFHLRGNSHKLPKDLDGQPDDPQNCKCYMNIMRNKGSKFQ